MLVKATVDAISEASPLKEVVDKIIEPVLPKVTYD
jgi:hypothetical protein